MNFVVEDLFLWMMTIMMMTTGMMSIRMNVKSAEEDAKDIIDTGEDFYFGEF